MKPTERKVGRKPRPGSRFLADVVADNVRAHRTLRRLSQGTLAERLRHFGHDWSHSTVSDVERAARNVTLDELLALAAALETTTGDLLDPTGFDGRRDEWLDHGRRDLEPFPPRLAREVLQGRIGVYPMWDGSTLQAGSYLLCDLKDGEGSRADIDEDVRDMNKRQVERLRKGKGKR